MDCWIEHPQEPRQLLLVWQAPVGVADRSRWVVGRLSETTEGTSFAYLEKAEFAEFNLGRSEEQLKNDGFFGFPAFDRTKASAWDDAVQTFLRRVPSRRRSDFNAYLRHHRVRASVDLSAMALLAVTEAHLPSDGFSLIDPLDPSMEVVDFTFEVAGFRHILQPTAPLQEGQPLTLEAEPDNKYDPLAIKVVAADVCIGYVNRLQAATIGNWLDARVIQCCVARLNGQPSCPRAYALASVRPVRSAMAA